MKPHARTPAYPPKGTARGHWILLGWLLAPGLACSGSISDPQQNPGAPVGAAGVGSGGFGGAATVPGGGGVGGSPGVAGNNPAQPQDPSGCTPTLPQRVVLLNDLQHANSVSGVLGEAARDPELQLSDDTKAFATKGLVVSTSLVHERMDQGEFAAASLESRFTDVTGCPLTGDAACARGFLERFAETAFRRPVASAEIDDLMTVFEVGAKVDFKSGVKLAVQALLSAPSFTYRTEIGQVEPNGVARLTPFELASELSYMMTDAPPDPELHAAAKSGALSSPDELTKQVERMLALPAVQESLKKTLMAAWQIGNIFGTVKDPGLFPQYNAALQSSMYRETDAFLQAVLWTRNAPVAELLTSRESFVDTALAAIYGVSVPGGGTAGELKPVTLPAERAGLLTQASLLSLLSRTDNTSVVARGLFVRGALLCLPKIPGPPGELAGEIMALLEADMTERERADVRATTSPCNGCHAQFDQFGLLLEKYDPLGRHRQQLDGEPIDTSVSLDNLGSFMGTFPDAVTFAQAASTAPEFTACLTRNLIAYGTGDDALQATDCQVSGQVAKLPPSPTMRDVVRAATASPALTYRTVETP
jgi:hypothetical protein